MTSACARPCRWPSIATAGSTNLSKISIMKHVGGIMRPGSEWALPDAELEKQVGYAEDIENRAPRRAGC